MLARKIAWAKMQIIERDKRKGVKRFHVPSEVKYVTSLGIFAFIHSGKATIPSLREKAVRAGLDLIGTTEALRVLLEREIQQVLKRDRLTDNFRLDALRYPLPVKARAGYWKDVVRVDVKRCFWSIYSRTGLDVRCKVVNCNGAYEVKAIAKGRLTAKNSELIRELREDKLARNAVVGLASSAFVTVFRSGKFYRQFYRSKVLNLELRAYICVLLNSVIQPLWDGIIYWNTDGGFVRQEIADALVDAFNSVGLEVRCEEAYELQVTCLGGYSWVDCQGEIHESGHYGKSGKAVEHRMLIKNQEEFLAWAKRLMLT